MQTSRTLRFVMMCSTATACKADPDNRPAVIELTVLKGRPIATGVYLNARGPFRFLFDTGAQTNQVDVAVAQQLGLSPTFRTELATVAGARVVPGTRVGEVRLGSARATDQEFLLTDLSGVHTLSSDVQGVLGQEFLAHFDYLIDLKSRTLIFGPRAPAGDHIPTGRIDGRLTLVTNVGNLVLDSGTDTLVLFRAGTSTTPASSRIRTANGSATVRSGSGLRIQIAGRDFRTNSFLIAPWSDASEDGILPLGVFRAVYVSNSGGYIVANPPAN
ncbi:MAG TPA: retropepsin-like aspartic protease [Terriglobales bacterium]